MIDIQAIGESYNAFLQTAASQAGISLQTFTVIMSLVAFWTLIWKGLALWKSAEKKQKLVFVLLLILNDFGILELVYYFWLSKLGFKTSPKQEKLKPLSKSKKKR